MIVILFLLVLFFFLFAGAAVFVCCILLPRARSHALSAALWCAVWGPCTIGLLLLAGLGLIADGLAAEHSSFVKLQKLPSILGPAYFLLGVTFITLTASVIAWFHQLAIERMTFALFRMYACLVTAGIGSVWGWTLSLLLSQYTHPAPRFILWLGAMILIGIPFGFAGFRWARLLRGQSPQGFTWITPHEYEGRP